MRKPMPHGGRRLDVRSLGRVVKLLFRAYPALLPIAAVCIVLSSLVSSVPALFVERVLTVITTHLENGSLNWAAAKSEILPLVSVRSIPSSARV